MFINKSSYKPHDLIRQLLNILQNRVYNSLTPEFFFDILKKTVDCSRIITLFLFFVMFSIYTNSSGMPKDTIMVHSRNISVEANSLYEVIFSLDKEIPKNATIIITFPDEFDLSQVSIAGSITINGGFKLSVQNSKVFLKRSGLGRIIKPHEKVNVKFANVKNPDNPSDGYEIKIEIQNDNNTTIVQEDSKIKIISQQKK